MALEPADETLGRYRLFARLGRGGMAELHVARMLGAAGVEKFVVVKRMLRHLADDPAFVKMFENEGRIAVRLEHPNVCQTYELGNVDGELFLVMELVRGLPWSVVVPRLPRDEVAACRFLVGVMIQACEGLHYAHHLTDAAGNASPVVHRDVTPGNLMITNEGAIKLLDFGVSKLLTDEHATRAGMIKGKLPYMSPEHIRGEPVDPRTDIFSLGVMVWEALARRPLFDRPSDLKIFKAIVEEPIPSLPPSPLTQRLELVLRRALARDRNDRYATARQMGDALRDAIAPAGLPMTQAEIQRAMSEWLAVELAHAHQDLATAINRLRGTADVARTPARADSDFTRTAIDRAEQTRVGAVEGEGDTEDDPPRLDSEPALSAPTAPRAVVAAARALSEDEAPTRPGTLEEMPTRPASHGESPTLLRADSNDDGPTRLAGLSPRDEDSEDRVSSAPTAPRRMPANVDAPTQAFHPPSAPDAPTASLQPTLRYPMPQPSLPQPGWQTPTPPVAPPVQPRLWVIILVMVSVAAGIIAAILSA